MRKAHAENVVRFALVNPYWHVIFWVDQTLQAKSVSHILANASMRPGGPVQLLEPSRHVKHFVHPTLYHDELVRDHTNDYLRLELVHLKGGIYADIDTVADRPLDAYGELFRQPFVVAGGGATLCNCLFGFGRGSPTVRFMLDAAEESCARFVDCKKARIPWGPPFLTGALLARRPVDVHVFAGYHLLVPQPGQESIVHQTFEGNWNKQHVLWKRFCAAALRWLDERGCRALELRIQRATSG